MRRYLLSALVGLAVGIGIPSSGQVSGGGGSSVRRFLIVFAAGDSGGQNPVSGNTNYFATFYGVDGGTSEANGGFIVPYTGRITYAGVRHVCLGTNGVDGENLTYTVRNSTAGTDSSTVAALDTDEDTAAGNVTNLGFAVTAGDRIQAKVVMPTFSVTPTVMFFAMVIVLES